MAITGPACFGFERSWLSKALRHLPERADLFADNAISEAQYLLGLGNRQVLALEYWMRNLGLICSVQPGRYRVSPLALVIGRYDPQLEEAGTWLALHGRLSEDRDAASTYWYATNAMPDRFTRDELLEELKGAFPGRSARTYGDAVSVFFSILNKTPLGKSVFQVSSASVERTADPPQLADAILLYALFRWCYSMKRTGVSLLEIAAESSPGRVFSVTDTYLRLFLDRVQDRYAKRVLWWSQTAGLDSISIDGNLPQLAVLRAYYIELLDGLSPSEALKRGIEEESAGGTNCVE